MDGKECLDHIKEIDPFVKAIVSSGYSDNPVLSDYTSHGFQDILKKPFSIRRLTEVIRSVLNPRFGR
jgi:two-component system cell cycle sensor histidine kinase/response regulator CckA